MVSKSCVEMCLHCLFRGGGRYTWVFQIKGPKVGNGPLFGRRRVNLSWLVVWNTFYFSIYWE